MKFFILFGTLIFASCFQNTSKPLSDGAVASEAQEEQALLFVVTGFSSETDNIRKDSLSRLVSSSAISFTTAASQKAKLFFNISKPLVDKDPGSFIKRAKNKLLICTLDELDPRLKVLSIDGKNFFAKDPGYFLSKGSNEDLFRKELTKVSITGVTAITRSAGMLADREGIDHLSAKFKDQFTNTDIMHMSNEVSMCDTCRYIGKTMKFCMKTDHAKPMITLGADVIELTGNHNLDYGKFWYQKSLDWYSKQGMKVVGGGANPEKAAEPLVLEMKDGSKLGWMAFNETCPLGECADKPGEMGANRYSKEKAEATILQLKKLGVSAIVCGMQFGEWDKYEPHAGQHKIAHELIDLGVDVVYGTANHQIQQVEFYKGKSIFYGLGNFLFDQVHRIGVRQAFFLHQFYYKGKHIQTIPVYTFMEANRQNRIATEAEKNEMKKLIFKDNLLYR